MSEFLKDILSNNRLSRTNIKADLRIMGEDLDVQKVTRVLGICPSKTWKKGDFIRNTERKRTYTAWIYSTRTMESLNINDLIGQIKDVFYPKADQIASLKESQDLDISIDIIIIIENEEPPAIYFEPDFIKFAAKIGAGFDVDTYIN